MDNATTVRARGRSKEVPDPDIGDESVAAMRSRLLGSTTPRLLHNRIRILVADDHDLIRCGVKKLLETRPEWEICGDVSSGEQAIAKALELKPHIVILDFSMPDLDGLEVAKRIRQESPCSEILMLSMHYSDELIRSVIAAGIKGYVVKSDCERDLLRAVEALSQHRPFFTTHATEVMLGTMKVGRPKLDLSAVVRERLTEREREVVQLLAEGRVSRQVADTLGISIKTVETHRANIMRKLELHNLSQLVRFAVRNKMIEA